MGNDNLKQFIAIINAKPEGQMIGVLGVVSLMMLLTWGVEALKWQRLVRSVERISFWLSTQSVFCGLTWAVFTPNRIGEYGGRVFFLSPKRRVIGIVAMAVGNIGQLVLITVVGAISGCIFVYRFLDIDFRLFMVVCVASAAFCAFVLVFYFNIKWLNRLLFSMRVTRRYSKFYVILARYQKAELLRIMLYCVVRYSISNLQYLIMFAWLIPGINYFDVLMMVTIQFVVQSTLPSLGLIDIGVRSVTAVALFNYITDQDAAIVACTASIWLINIIIPAILGTYFVFKLNFFGSNQRT